MATTPHNYQFKNGGDEGIILIGLRPLSGGYSLCIQEYYPETGLRRKSNFPVKQFFNSHSMMSKTDPALEYVAATVNEGDYFISQISIQDYDSSRTYVKQNNAMTFSVKAGEVIYLGEFKVSKFGALDHAGFDLNKANEFLETYPNIKTPITQANIQYKSIKNSK